VSEDFARVCAAVIEPLRAFLDHPEMNKKIAHSISDEIQNLFNEQSPGVSSGEHIAHLLGAFARGER
jgi:hypothetical protein